MLACERDASPGNDAGAPDTSQVVPHEADAAVPSGLTTPEGLLYQFDTTTPEIMVPIDGDGANHISGRLRDSLGRRELLYGSITVAPAGWHLPPASAVARGGRMATCFNTLTGASSRLTAPGTPDPSRGMVLTCRVREASGTWSTPIVLDTPTRGVWLQRVFARDDGTFRVLFYGDNGYLVGPLADGHGVYETILSNGTFSPPMLLAPATDPGGPETTEFVDSP
jgi:hypothetical protein